MRKYQVRFRGRGREQSRLRELSPLPDEIDPDDTDRCFGLCDLGMGCPELGYVSLTELASVRGPLGLRIERDLHFVPAKPIAAYAYEARERGAVKA